eukprot:356004-Chlamydomonas_euryale.AAC.4
MWQGVARPGASLSRNPASPRHPSIASRTPHLVIVQRIALEFIVPAAVKLLVLDPLADVDVCVPGGAGHGLAQTSLAGTRRASHHDVGPAATGHGGGLAHWPRRLRNAAAPLA